MNQPTLWPGSSSPYSMKGERKLKPLPIRKAWRMRWSVSNTGGVAITTMIRPRKRTAMVTRGRGLMAEGTSLPATARHCAEVGHPASPHPRVVESHAGVKGGRGAGLDHSGDRVGAVVEA